MMSLQKEVFVTENTKTNTVLSHCNDVFFKYVPSREDEGSVYARNTIIECATGIEIKESIVLSSNLDLDIIGKKRTILDVHVKDEKDRFLNLEVQATYAGAAEMMHFEFYGARALNNQLDCSEKCRDLKPVYQIIFIKKRAWNNKSLINHYRMRSEQGEDESKHPLIRRTYIHLPAISEIAKKEAIQQMDGFERLCFLFENNVKNNILGLKRRLVKVFMNKYEEMQKDNKLWSIAMAIQMGEARHRCGLEDSFEEGMKEGIIRGKAEGKAEGKIEGRIEGKSEGERQFLHRFMEVKFQEDCTAWLQSLTEDQLHIVSNLLLKYDTLESVKKQLNRHNTI